MYSYGGSLYKKNGSLKSQLNRKPPQKLPLTEETCLAGLKILKKDGNQRVFLKDYLKNEK